MTTIHDVLKRQLEFTNVSEYHKQGFTGKGIVVLNTESEKQSHGEMTNRVLKEFAPGAIIINGEISSKTKGNILENCNITIDGAPYDFEEVIKKFNIKLVTTSKAGSTSNPLLNYFKDIQKRLGVIFFCSAGNDGTSGVTGKYTKNNTAIAVGAAYIYEDGKVSITHYSSQGDELDFVAPLGTGSGTSAACPALTGMTALLLQKYGDFTQEECVEILKSIAMELGEPGKDKKFGWGLPILPLADKLEILEKLRGEKMPQFKDVEDTRWSKDAIKYCTSNGILKGFPDGTFKPSEPLTREQYAQAEYNKAKLEGRI